MSLHVRFQAIKLCGFDKTQCDFETFFLTESIVVREIGSCNHPQTLDLAEKASQGQTL
jgi:hypothetical protein